MKVTQLCLTLCVSLLTVGQNAQYSLQGGCLPSWQQGKCHDAAAAGMLRVGRGETRQRNKSKSQREWESKFKDPTPTSPDHQVPDLAANGSSRGG